VFILKSLEMAPKMSISTSVDYKRLTGLRWRAAGRAKRWGMLRPTDRKWSSLSHTSYYHKSTVLVKLEGTKLRRAQKMAQVAETNSVINILTKLDKHTLNMYTTLRAGLGTQGLSWIRPDFREIRANGHGTKFQEEWQQ